MAPDMNPDVWYFLHVYHIWSIYIIWLYTTSLLLKGCCNLLCHQVCKGRCVTPRQQIWPIHNRAASCKYNAIWCYQDTGSFGASPWYPLFSFSRWSRCIFWPARYPHLMTEGHPGACTHQHPKSSVREVGRLTTPCAFLAWLLQRLSSRKS